jgi:hypothetical protein
MWHSRDRLDSAHTAGFAHVVRGALVRLVLSVLIPVAWISLTLVYVGFFAPTWTLGQDIVLVIVSILALLGALTVMWVSFGVGLYHAWVE